MQRSICSLHLSDYLARPQNGSGDMPPASCECCPILLRSCRCAWPVPISSLTQVQCCGAEWNIPQKGQVLVHIPQMEQIRAVGVREGLKKSLKPPWMYHLVAHFTVHRAFQCLWLHTSLLFKFLCKLCDNISSSQCQETLGYIHKYFTESLKTQ